MKVDFSHSLTVHSLNIQTTCYNYCANIQVFHKSSVILCFIKSENILICAAIVKFIAFFMVS